MDTQLTRRTVENYLPVLRAIYASLEVTLAAHNLEERDILHFAYLEKEFGGSKLQHVTYLLQLWLAESKFEVQSWRFHKKDKSVKWSELMQLLNRKIMEYHNDTAVIQITMSRNGRTVREVNGSQLIHDFGSDGLKKELILFLAQYGDFIKIKEIQKIIGSKSTESVAKIILAINTVLRTKLQLPRTHKFIDSKRGSGYRINPIYNLILTD